MSLPKVECQVYESFTRVTLNYPERDPSKTTEIEIQLSDIRAAADPIRVRYDFGRDGWVILQASKFEGESEDFDMDWQEVAFVQAWGRCEDEKRNE
jgi:hypothetical protein